MVPLNKFSPKLFFYFVLISYFSLLITQVFGAAPQELKDNINKRNQELQEINSKIKEFQKNIEETQGQSKSLEKEIQKVNRNVDQLNLSIRSSEITLDKLALEIDSIQYGIGDTENEIVSKKDAIVKTIQEIQKKDKETPLIIFLKNKTLAESVFETQNLLDLNTGLTNAVTDLGNTKQQLADQLNQTSEKKQEIASENSNLKNKKLILDDTKKDKQNLLQQTKNKEQLYQKSLSELEKRQAAIADEIEKLEEELRLKIDPTALPGKRPGVLGMPILGGILSQDYGATRFAKYGYRGKWHNGVDFAAPIGTPIFAAEKGKVLAVENQDLYCYRGAYGKFITIEHENNLTTLYAHLSLQIVKKGDIVQRGQLIGYVGRTGYATGPHLHLTVYASQTFRFGPSKINFGPHMPYGGDLNPMDYP